MTKDEALKLALEAVEHVHRTGDTQVFDMCYAEPIIAAIKAALAQLERPWVGLTPTDMEELSAEWWEPNENEMALISWVEAKLKEKNT